MTINNQKQPDHSNKLTVVYADDEQPARDKLKYQLSLIPDIEVVGYATTGKEAITLINEEQPDLVFLDIQMPEINGLDLLSLLNYTPLVIYTTAYDQYAIKAFEQASIDYLLKPYPLSRLKAAIDKARTHWLGQQHATSLSFDANQNTDSVTEKTTRLVSKHGERIAILSPDDVFYISSENSQTFASDGMKNHPLNDTLNQLETTLDENQFIRIHRSYIINLDKIKEIQRWFNGKLMVIINDDKLTQLSTSRAGAEKLKHRLGL